MAIYMSMTSEPTDPFEFCGRIYPATGGSYPVPQPPITITTSMPMTPSMTSSMMTPPYNFTPITIATTNTPPDITTGTTDMTLPPSSLEDIQTRIDKNAQNIQTLQTSVRLLNTYIRMNPDQYGTETAIQTEMRHLIDSVRIMERTSGIRLRQVTYIGTFLSGVIICGIVYGIVTQLLS